jgi:hypothetical protein
MYRHLVIGAVKLDYLPLPDRSLRGTMPFNPSQGLSHGESKLMRAAKAVPFFGVAILALEVFGAVVRLASRSII